jgi:hypothetical protein
VDFADLRDQAQHRLIDFLHADLDLAFTYLKMAQTRENGRERLLENARKVLHATQHFEGRVADKNAWTAIHERAGELERALSGFTP